MKIPMLLRIALLACSETDNRPILELPKQPVPIITFDDSVGWGHGSVPGYGPANKTMLQRHVSYYLVSDIPMPAATYILVNDRLFRMDKGETKLTIVFKKICSRFIDYDHPMFMGEIKPAHERFQYLPYHLDGIHLPEGYRFNSYKVGDKPSIAAGLWCK